VLVLGQDVTTESTVTVIVLAGAVPAESVTVETPTVIVKVLAATVATDVTVDTETDLEQVGSANVKVVTEAGVIEQEAWVLVTVKVVVEPEREHMDWEAASVKVVVDIDTE
jgi:hypothetical protein